MQWITTLDCLVCGDHSLYELIMNAFVDKDSAEGGATLSAVPTAAKTQAFNAKSKSASGIMTAALLPPNSRIVLPNLLATSWETCLPT